jgi:hypothetical protein
MSEIPREQDDIALRRELRLRCGQCGLWSPLRQWHGKNDRCPHCLTEIIAEKRSDA